MGKFSEMSTQQSTPFISAPHSSASTSKDSLATSVPRRVAVVMIFCAVAVLVSAVVVMVCGVDGNGAHNNSPSKVTGDAPMQIHIAQGNGEGTALTVSWITRGPVRGAVVYKADSSSDFLIKNATTPAFQYTYEYLNQPGTYTSGYIHHVTISDLNPLTLYRYICGDDVGGWSEPFEFIPWGSDGLEDPFTFFVVGDLGQTDDSASTVDHMVARNTPFYPLLLVGDLSYADSANTPRADDPCTQKRWDSWGEIMERFSASSPLMVLPGNHEIEYNPQVKSQTPFLALQSRFRMPSLDADAQPNLYYSFKTPFAHVIMLNSYDGDKQEGPYDSTTAQYKWLEADLQSINRKESPWVIACMHAPWYNSNAHHHNEVQEVTMRAAMEPLFYKYGVNIVFAGHVHAYERTHPVYDNQTTPNGMTYITIGDGGNREGHAFGYFDQPDWSAFRDPSFGHGEFTIYNATHAYWGWHRNDFGEEEVSDEVWLIREGATMKSIQMGEFADQTQVDLAAHLIVH